jgi:hypothetical protein
MADLRSMPPVTAFHFCLPDSSAPGFMAGDKKGEHRRLAYSYEVARIIAKITVYKGASTLFKMVSI